LATVVVGVVVSLAPLYLFADPIRTYRLHSDDFAYLGASRTLARTIQNLFVPHNTHIVPAWRLLTWGVIACARDLAHLQTTLAIASYGALVLTMLLIGHFIAHETGKTCVGIAAMLAMGTTSLLKFAASWYSAGQTLWAGIGILGMLILLQDWRRLGGTWRLILAAFAAWVAGGFWTIGHAAGPVGAVYLWSDGRPRARRAAIVPLSATGLAIAIALILGGRQIDATISFHGRTAEQAFDPYVGMSHTLQAIPEDLVLGNAGVVTKTTVWQGMILSLLIAGLWAWSRRQGWTEDHDSRARVARTAFAAYSVALIAGIIVIAMIVKRRPTTQDLAAYAAFAALGAIVISERGSPLERAGAALLLSAYLVEWSFRGYFTYDNLRGVVPWYDTIPHIGAVLFVAGWWTRANLPVPTNALAPLTRGGATGILVFAVAMIVVHQPRVDTLFIESVPKMNEREANIFVTRKLQKLRAEFLADARAQWQHRHLKRLDHAESRARELGIGRQGIAGAFGRIKIPDLPKVYDAALLLGLPWRGVETDPIRIRRALAPDFAMEPEPAIPPELLRTHGSASILNATEHSGRQRP
jgi:hypothetical protein